MAKKAISKKKTLKIEDVKPHPKNPKKHWDEGLRKSIDEMGYIEPVVVDENNQLLAGHGRIKILKEKGYEEVDAIVVEGLTEEQKEKYLLYSNKIGEVGGWDNELLQEFPEDILFETGFASTEIDNLFDEVEEDDFEVEEHFKDEPKSKRGDVYKLGEHRLMCGDATNEEGVTKLMGGKKGRLVFTDPPYNVDYESQKGHSCSKGKYGGKKMLNDNKGDEEYLQFCIDVLVNLAKSTTDDASIYWWFANGNNHIINRMAFVNTDWKMSQVLIWVKENFVFSHGQDYHRCYEPVMFGWKEKERHYRNKGISNVADVSSLDFEDFNLMLDFWYEHRDNTQAYLHPTQKPVRLAERALKKNSQRGDIVIDLFGGSGSTLIACEQLDRKCYMMELDPAYVDVIIDRWEAYTGKKAKKTT